MVGVQNLRVGSFTQRLIAKKYRQNKTRGIVVAALMLTSMVDMFSLLVIFLLQSFSTSNEVLTLKNGLVLPSAVSGSSTQDAPVVSISQNMITVDNSEFGSPEAVLKSPNGVLEALQKIKTGWMTAHKNEPFKGIVHLEADQKISSALVSQVISILVSQGYGSVHLAVVTGR